MLRASLAHCFGLADAVALRDLDHFRVEVTTSLLDVFGVTGLGPDGTERNLRQLFRLGEDCFEGLAQRLIELRDSLQHLSTLRRCTRNVRELIVSPLLEL